MMLLVNTAHAQGTINFTGFAVIENGTSIPIKLTFVNQTKIDKGISISDEGGGSETRAQVALFFLPNRKKLIMSETTVLSSKASNSDNDFCLLTAQLSVQKRKGVVVLKGPFVGKLQKNGSICAKGVLTLNASEVPIMFAESGDEMLLSTLVDTTMLLSGKKMQVFNWLTDTLHLELWDDGQRDGDRISMMRNEQVLFPDKELGSEKYSYTEVAGANALVSFTIKALNEGSISPNTAKLSFDDGKKKVTLYLKIKKGEEVKLLFKRVS